MVLSHLNFYSIPVMSFSCINLLLLCYIAFSPYISFCLLIFNRLCCCCFRLVDSIALFKKSIMAFPL